jgi:uncharacterized membrane protein
VPGRGRRLLSSPDELRSAAWLTRHRVVAFATSALVAAIVYVVVPMWLHGATRFVAAYDAGTLTLLGFFWLHGLHDDPKLTRARAALEDPGRNAITLVILTAVVVGLVAAIAIVGHGPKVQNVTEQWEAYILGVLAICIGWFLVHTVYTFRYAHLYYYDEDGDGCGGIHFPGTDEPSDMDFAYFSFCLGTSFAVSDPQVTETRVRREVIVHSIIAFAYNSVIVGMVINLFAGIFAASSGSK